MAPKYARGQRVAIRSVKNQQYQLKYPEIEQYVREVGTVVGSYLMQASEPGSAGASASNLSDNYFYRVQLFLQNKLITVPEEALEPSDADD